MRNVAIGPKKIDTIHQFKPLLPFVCARPAFMRESVNQPTAYCPVSRIIINSHSKAAWLVLFNFMPCSTPPYDLAWQKKPRQPLRDLSPFDSIFLILRRVVSAAGLFPPCFPSSPEGKALATYLAWALRDLCRKPIPAPLKCHGGGRGTSVRISTTLGFF